MTLALSGSICGGNGSGDTDTIEMTCPQTSVRLQRSVAVHVLIIKVPHVPGPTSNSVMIVGMVALHESVATATPVLVLDVSFPQNTSRFGGQATTGPGL